MVRAILAGKKTQTRRIVKPSRGEQSRWLSMESLHGFVQSGEMAKGGWQMWHPKGGPRSPFGWIKCPYGSVGDQLWVRETWKAALPVPASSIQYRADGQLRPGLGDWEMESHSWRPSIHMPRWASRLTLEITGVRVERLQSISEEDCWSERIERSKESPTQASTIYSDYAHPRRAFSLLWDSLAKPGADWASNPFCWVIEFKRLTSSDSCATSAE